ncbi:MAG: hypothetical protein JW769_02750 [Parachlamydiales bacterium]|nr:hypothetical protein [Parachlamydiales bacterium]
MIFEAVMLVCFGAAWPFSVYTSWKSQSNQGKNVVFLYIIFLGYLSGITHKILIQYDFVIYLYYLNAVLVIWDIVLFHRNARIKKTRN